MASAAAPGLTATGFLAALDEASAPTCWESAVGGAIGAAPPCSTRAADLDAIVVVLSGRVKVSTVTPEGKEVVLAFRGPGDLLGELSAIDGEARSATVGALEAVDAAVVAATDFRAFLSAHPRVAILLPGNVRPAGCATPIESASSSARTTRWGAWRRGWSSLPSATGRP